MTENARCASGLPRDRQRPQSEERALHEASDTCLIEAGVNGALQCEQRMNRILREQQQETDEAVSRVEFDLAEFEREEDQTLSTSSLDAFDDGSESATATLCSTKAFSEYLAETTLAFV